ncbi:16S rRNA pseudouridine(516) synthase RsuA [Psychrobium sp. MM17-31]|nr:16S rRNA pseudouridine(516) synthase RsuA [Psychrobium sp. MM17-31]
MRLDKFLSDNANLTRKTAKQALHRGYVTVDGVIVRKGDLKIDQQCVMLAGQQVSPIGQLYIMLNKPAGYVCSTVDDDGISVLNLIDEPWCEQLHIAGRLDKDTTGLVLLTNDGQWSHRITSPSSKCDKTYEVTLDRPLTQELVEVFANGIMLNNENKPTKPAQLTILNEHRAELVISEGKYHQVKRMFAAVGNHVTALHRSRVGSVRLDGSLQQGDWVRLTEQQYSSFF